MLKPISELEPTEFDFSLCSCGEALIELIDERRVMEPAIPARRRTDLTNLFVCHAVDTQLKTGLFVCPVCRRVSYHPEMMVK